MVEMHKTFNLMMLVLGEGWSGNLYVVEAGARKTQ
jgi:hypothetical protein